MPRYAGWECAPVKCTVHTLCLYEDTVRLVTPLTCSRITSRPCPHVSCICRCESQYLRVSYIFYERVRVNVNNYLGRLNSLPRHSMNKCTVSPYKHSICTIHLTWRSLPRRSRSRWTAGTARGHSPPPLRSLQATTHRVGDCSHVFLSSKLALFLNTGVSQF